MAQTNYTGNRQQIIVNNSKIFDQQKQRFQNNKTPIPVPNEQIEAYQLKIRSSSRNHEDQRNEFSTSFYNNKQDNTSMFRNSHNTSHFREILNLTNHDNFDAKSFLTSFFMKEDEQQQNNNQSKTQKAENQQNIKNFQDQNKKYLKPEIQFNNNDQKIHKNQQNGEQQPANNYQVNNNNNNQNNQIMKKQNDERLLNISGKKTNQIQNKQILINNLLQQQQEQQQLNQQNYYSQQQVQPLQKEKVIYPKLNDTHTHKQQEINQIMRSLSPENKFSFSAVSQQKDQVLGNQQQSNFFGSQYNVYKGNQQDNKKKLIVKNIEIEKQDQQIQQQQQQQIYQNNRASSQFPNNKIDNFQPTHAVNQNNQNNTFYCIYCDKDILYQNKKFHDADCLRNYKVQKINGLVQNLMINAQQRYNQYHNSSYKNIKNNHIHSFIIECLEDLYKAQSKVQAAEVEEEVEMMNARAEGKAQTVYPHFLIDLKEILKLAQDKNKAFD